MSDRNTWPEKQAIFRWLNSLDEVVTFTPQEIESLACGVTAHRLEIQDELTTLRARVQELEANKFREGLIELRQASSMVSPAFRIAVAALTPPEGSSDE